ncbi:MAG: NfeD family protein [Pyrinomonadaceae bacterium]|nr:NfeD family protein [Pyrinomonadaceae bacterium]
MESYLWIMWAAAGVLLIIAEIFTLGFVLFWFGIGAMAAALAAYLGLGLVGQFIVFAGVSILFTILSRTIFDDYYPHNDEDHSTGIENLPGRVGTVTTESKGALNAARVKVFGSSWKAFPADEVSTFDEGEKVEVVRVEGSSIWVKKASKELPGWRDEEEVG